MTAWAFVVGINEYPPSSKLRTLRGAVADAAEFANWALHPQGGAVAPNNLFFWTTPAPVAPPPAVAKFMADPTPWPQTRPDFTRAPGTQEICMGIYLVAANALIAKASRLYVFFAGHGFQTKRQDFEDPPQTCFVTGDYDPRMMAAGLVPCDDMARMLKVAGPPEIVIFLDACREDARLSVARPRSPWNTLSDPGQHKMICVGRAAQEQRVAYEVPHGQPTRGAFSTLLINALSTHRVNGKLTARDLENFVGEGIGPLVAPYEQYPDIEERPKPWKMVLASGQEIVGPPDIVLQIINPPAGGLMLVGGPQDVRQPMPNTVGTHSLPMPPGTYVLETSGGQELSAFTHIGPGATHVQL